MKGFLRTTGDIIALLVGAAAVVALLAVYVVALVFPVSEFLVWALHRIFR